MPANQTALYAGVLLIVLGAIVWTFKKPGSPEQNVIRGPGGFEFSLNTPPLAVIALGIVLVLIAMIYSGNVPAPPSPAPIAAPPSPEPTVPLKKVACIGQSEDRCGLLHAIFYRCGEWDPDSGRVAKDLCEGGPIDIRVISQKLGDMCGYALVEITCH